MGENKPHRRPLRVTVEKQLLILHNKVICIGIVRSLGLPVTELAVSHLSLLIYREIACMGVVRRDGIQILYVRIVANLALHIADNIAVLLFKHIGVDTVIWFSRFVVLLVFSNFVDKEQAQNLYALVEQLTLALNMRKYSLAYLYAAKLVFAYTADNIAGIHLYTIEKLNRVVPAIDS